MMFTQTQPDASKAHLKPALKPVVQTRTTTTQHKPTNRVTVENRDGSDTEESASEEVFRTQRVWLDEDDDLNSLWTLKRANPVVDAEEEDEVPHYYESPSKRSRLQKLSWNDEVCSDAHSLLFASDIVFRSSTY